MNSITVNELRTRGVSVLEKALKDGNEAIISVRGKPCYVVVNIEQYERMRDAEIFAAWQETREALVKGDCIVEKAEEHIARLKKESAADAV